MRLIDADVLKSTLEIEQYNDYEDLLRTERLIEKAPTIEIPTAQLDVQTTNISYIAGPNGVYYGCINCYAKIRPDPHFKFCPGCGRKIV